MHINFLSWLQFPLKLSQYQDKTAGEHLGLNYVTERILASVLPNRAPQQQRRDNELAEIGNAITTLDESPQDIYEQELISMLEQKHGKVNSTSWISPAKPNYSSFFFRI